MKQRICQSCGMSMPTDDLLGTHGNGCLCTEYCCHCFQKGFFTNNSLEEQIELNAQPESLAAFNEASGSNFTKEEAIEGLRKFLPTLKRWMPIRQQAEWVLEQCGYITLSTVSENGYPRPVAIDLLRHTGISTLWMTTALSTEKVKHIRQNSKAGVCFVHEADSVTLTGKIEILTDAETRQSFWQDYMLHYFPQGVNDLDYCILCFHAKEAVLWIDRKFERIVL